MAREGGASTRGVYIHVQARTVHAYCKCSQQDLLPREEVRPHLSPAPCSVPRLPASPRRLSPLRRHPPPEDLQMAEAQKTAAGPETPLPAWRAGTGSAPRSGTLRSLQSTDTRPRASSPSGSWTITCHCAIYQAKIKEDFPKQLLQTRPLTIGCILYLHKLST